jgi:hypothetical protein
MIDLMVIVILIIMVDSHGGFICQDGYDCHGGFPR